MRVTGLFSRSVTDGAPFAYEPPTIEILAVCAVSEIRWKSGTTDGSVVLAVGKSVPTATVYSVPFTEMTAVPGLGSLALAPPDEDLPPRPALEPPPAPPVGDVEPNASGFLSLSCCANGSLLAKRLNDVS